MTLVEAKQEILGTQRTELARVAKAQGQSRREKLESLVPTLVGLGDPTGVAAVRGAAALEQVGTWGAGLQAEAADGGQAITVLDRLNDETAGV